MLRSIVHGLAGVVGEDIYDLRTATMERVNMMH